LAGILLKLGGVALLRLSSILDFYSLKFYLLSYFLFFLVFSTFICCYQSDFKRLVAYSSVAHMITIPIMLFAYNLYSFKSILLILFFHGLSSPLLFIMVGLIYGLIGSRQLILIRGLMLISPLFSLVSILAFFFTISAPPFPSFVAEVSFIASSCNLSSFVYLFFGLFIFMALVYNLH
jgi:NADH-quinone oxidoreductase subunit M